MADRDQRNLRGPVRTVICETFDWDSKAGGLSQKPTRREELTFSPAGSLLESTSQFQDESVHRSTNVYDNDGGLRETRWRNPDGTEGSVPAKYDEYGQPIRFGADVTYSFESGRKVKTEVFKPNTPGVHRILGFAEGSQQGSWAQDAALAATFYDALGRPSEIVFYDEEHVQISRLVRTYDERGRVSSEENQLLSPRFFERQTSTHGEQMPKEAAQIFAQAFRQHPMRIMYKYDDHDRVIEETQDMGLFGCEKTVSLYNDRGDLSTQRHYSTHQGDVPIDDDGNILAPPPVPEMLDSETAVSYQYDTHGNWTRKETSTVYESGSRWQTIETRLITYY